MADTDKLFIAAQRWWTGERRWPRDVTSPGPDQQLGCAEAQNTGTLCPDCGRRVHVDCRCQPGE